ncbi:outer membrane protein assembly factor BamE [Undibacterium sp. Jales W-56]|uniref:outer membrane protein assembly factor BamE domain-containing protein n=1 Tax=Undibacterium sp. Jales W-56 TaxID=2897325 RepID=UPI0021CDFB11|nr:outer membrane protein assembly factor BamE [Undibacterium sp. Jales W-56]MCU6435211.1 outer membrane protein assembly factor BamE [Undibacterium sp. Jales W-56]
MNLSRILASSVILLSILNLSSCVSYGIGSVKAGQTEPEVTAKLGKPTHIYQDGNQHIWEYMRGRMAQATHMARFDHDGRLISYEQVLTLQKFAQVKVGIMDKTAVLNIIGAPSETAYYPRVQLEAWSYPYKESGVWNSLMTVYFDQSGIVKKLENGPDPLFEPGERRWRF